MSIRAVAKLAGVAPSTVSLVLNAPESVAQDTRKAVLSAIEELSYVPRERGRPKRGSEDPRGTRRSNRMALIVCGTPNTLLQAPVYMEVLHGVEAGLEEHELTMVLRRIEPSSEFGRKPFSTSVDGVILFGEPAIDSHLLNVPCVQIMGQIRYDRAWDHVTYDNMRIGSLVAEHLLARNHRVLAFVGEQCDNNSCGMQRGRAFQSAAKSVGAQVHMITQNSLYVKSCESQVIDRDRLQNIVADLERAKPTAVFVEADLLTASLYFKLYEKGIRPGSNFEIVSCNNERMLLHGLNPQPATVDIHARQIGRRAVEQLLWRIEHPNDQRVTIALEPRLVLGS